MIYFRDPKCLALDNIDGFILNVPTEYKLGFVLLPLKKRHWIALRKIHGIFYNLDSKLDSPQLIGKDDELLLYLKDQIESKEKELFLIVSREVASNQDWLKKLNTCNHYHENYSHSREEIRYIEESLTLNINKLDEQMSNDEKDNESDKINTNER